MVSRKVIRKIVSCIVMTLILIIMLFPIYWLVSSSFKRKVDIISPTPKFIFTPTLSNYLEVLSRAKFLQSLINSLIVSFVSLLIGMVLGILAAYVLSRFDFKHKGDVSFFILSMRFLPPVAVVIPYYSIWTRLKLYDTYIALIITYLLICLPITILLMTENFKNVPIELEEAAMLDGCSRLQAFYKITLLNAISAMICVGIFAFIILWNEFFIAFLLTQHNLTLPVMVAAFATIGAEIPWAEVCASASLLLVPPIIFAGIFYKVLISCYLPRR